MTVVDGERELTPVPGDDPNIDVYVKGDLAAPDLRQGCKAGHFGDVFGQFVVLVHDRAKKSLTVYNDRYGQLAFFVARGERTLFFSTRIGPLLERGVVPRRLDRSALATAMASGAPFDHRTLIEGITSYPAGTRTTIDLASRRVEEAREWDPAAILREPELPFAETKGALFDAFMEGFDRYVSGQTVAITLSGGIDSRCFLAAARYRGKPVSCFNCSVSGSRSSNYARAMSEMTRSPYGEFPVGLEFSQSYAERVRTVLDLTDGMTFNSGVEAHWLRDHISGMTVMLHGAFAELSKLDSMHVYFVDRTAARATRDELADVLWQRLRTELARNLAAFSAPLREDLYARAKRDLDARLRRIDPALTVPQALQVMYLEELLFTVTKCGSILWNDGIPTRLPFSYPPYLDLVLRTASADRMRQHFQMYLLTRTCPPLFRFPDANTGLRVDAPEPLNELVAIVDKARRVLTTSPVARDHSHQAYWIANMSTSPETILLEGTASQALDRGETKRLLARLREPPPKTRNPVAFLRHRVKQRTAASAIEKALQFQFWLDQAGVRVD